MRYPTEIKGTEGYLTSEFYSRVFRISRGKSIGTCFLGSKNGKSAFVTAKHILENEKNAPILIHRSNDRVDCEAFDIVLGEHDCASFQSHVFGEISAPLPVKLGGQMLGGQVFYLGFPFELTSGNLPNSDTWPIPFVKRATLSGTDSKTNNFYLDGMNVSGFSGGPVFFWDPLARSHTVGAIISGYYKDHYPVRTAENWYKNTDLLSEGNSGIIIAAPLGSLFPESG